MKFYYNIILILLFCFSFSEENSFIVELENTDEKNKYQKVPPIGNKELTFLNGDPVKFNDLYKDGPVLFNFWFLSCGPCRLEMKYLSKFNKKYKDTGFKVLSVNTDKKSKGKVKRHVETKKYSFDVLFDVNGDGFLKKLGGNLCPFTVLINMDGTIYSKHMGFELGDEVALEKDILEFIEYNRQFSTQDIENPSTDSLIYLDD